METDTAIDAKQLRVELKIPVAIYPSKKLVFSNG
jgi:hypothetical protein